MSAENTSVREQRTVALTESQGEASTWTKLVGGGKAGLRWNKRRGQDKRMLHVKRS